jgi:NADP-dependent 3-hydroxy acid dehydrogenase YdfG
MRDKVVLIAGGSGGIGKATAELFAKGGAKVVLAARNTVKAEETAKRINAEGGEAYVANMDVRNLASVSTVAADIVKDLGKIDVLVNAFGEGVILPVLDINPQVAENVIMTNVYGTFLVTQTVLRYMIEAKNGCVVMFPGTMGKYVMKNASLYAATKFAITGMTKALIEETRRTNIKFTLIYSGGVDTPFWDSPNIDMRVQREKMLAPAEIAKAVYYAASQPANSVLNEIVLQPESHQLV